MAARAWPEAARAPRGEDGGLPGAGGGLPGGAEGEEMGADGGSRGTDGLGRADGLGGADGARPGRHRPSRARRGRISPALRRLVVTPTFAAGLGLVVAAFLAANMSRAVLHFSAPIPGRQCSAGDCHVQEPHGGTLASARPGVHITPSVPAGSGPVTGVQRGGTASAGGGSGTPQPSAGTQPLSLSYQQVEHWPGGFADEITISGLNGTRTRAWSLAFGYPGKHIDGVQGARWEPGSTGGGVVAQGVLWPGWGQAQGSTAPVRLMVIVEGQPAPPSGCAFDGNPCTFASPGTP